MATKPKFQAIRGTRDLLPPETALWNRVEETARQVFGTFGFGEIRPPILEPTELFARSIGAETDIVGKEMYSFPAVRPQGSVPELSDAVERAWQGGEIENTSENERRMQQFRDLVSQVVSIVSSDTAVTNPSPQCHLSLVEMNRRIEEMQRSISLRPEATASVCRAYIEHNMQQLPQPVKLYYLGPMFRRERPQKGRYRQFYQIGAEVLEAVRPDAANQNVAKELHKDATTDAEVIEMVMTFFDSLQLPGVQLDINSIGHNADNCRRGYVATLKSALEKIKGQLGADSQRRIDTNPLRVLDSKL